MTTRDEIIAEARTYIGTPFHHQGRLKNAGVDCIGLVVGVAKIFGLEDYDDYVYPKYPEKNQLMPKLETILERVDIEDAEPGDVLVFWINRHTRIPQHIGLKTDVGMLHTFETIGRVVEHGLTKKWRRRLCAAFRFPGVK